MPLFPVSPDERDRRITSMRERQVDFVDDSPGTVAGIARHTSRRQIAAFISRITR
ncbi:hypothetical protein [Neoroseomonas soli]|uniref:Uncharacterized protein n=1 Tax=Neoroseomonas soli TaxID=1081025 RepID=A0A9X9WSX3_9PROT|nr:hypothetical protein [Neoroseomonas soli]MBR0670252.1 hypothetical protein [Neoroseomonas soli]